MRIPYLVVCFGPSYPATAGPTARVAAVVDTTTPPPGPSTQTALLTGARTLHPLAPVSNLLFTTCMPPLLRSASESVRKAWHDSHRHYSISAASSASHPIARQP